MSECVVRMEMPENCCECHLRKEDYDTGDEFCPFTGVECLSIGRQDNCPIVCALPEGHGRLVDADYYAKTHAGGEMIKFAKTIVPAERSIS